MSRPQEEFREFVKIRVATLHRNAYLLCGDWHLANDLVQEALSKTFRNWQRVQRADSPDAYILINESSRYWRARRNLAPHLDAGEHEAVTPDATDEIVYRAGPLQALLSLPARQRATGVLCA
jgi:DNA-directed RNA polymerase specialized sigma24 family protein